MNIGSARRLFVGVESVLAAALVAVAVLIVGLPAQHAEEVVVTDTPADALRPDAPGTAGGAYDRAVFIRGLHSTRNAPVAAAVTAPPVAPSEAWKTEVAQSLKVKGTYIAALPDASVAVLKWGDKEELLYGPGERITGAPEGVTLGAVAYDRVEVRKGGDLVTVAVEEYRSAGVAAAPPPAPMPEPDAASGPPPGEPMLAGADTLTPTQYGPDKYALKRGELEPYIKSPEKMFTQMTVRPQTENGEPTGGYIITGMQGNALLKKIGLRNGDVIMRVNGQTPINMMNAISDPAMGEIAVEYMRAGRRQTLHYTIQD
ncbi:MAG: type II secretion system protein N [Planctomycetota bacterium]